MSPNEEYPPEVIIPPKGGPIRIPIHSLFAGRTEIILVHNDEDYRLRITSRGKLILTK